MTLDQAKDAIDIAVRNHIGYAVDYGKLSPICNIYEFDHSKVIRDG